MKYYYKNQEITSKAEWKIAFCEAYNSNGEDKHWKDGRSGECLAEDFVGENPTGEMSMEEMLLRFLGSDNISLDVAKIEFASAFDEYPRPRKQDLAIWGRVDNKAVFIAIEAKVDEQFGSKSLAQQRNYVEGLKKTKADKRLNELVDNYLDGDKNGHGKLRYQLLYYLAGSFCEKNADIIFMPVIVYKTRAKNFNEYSENKGRLNQSAYKQFMTELNFSQMEQVIGGQIIMAYYKRVSAYGKEKDVYSCYIVK
ncbi:MAG: DUF6946 family protein [Candidatus Cryptobacteroides sp.]